MSHVGVASELFGYLEGAGAHGHLVGLRACRVIQSGYQVWGLPACAVPHLVSRVADRDLTRQLLAGLPAVGLPCERDRDGNRDRKIA